MAFKKYFYIVIASYVLLFMVFPAFAGWETAQIVDFGVIQNIPNTAVTITMSSSGTIKGSGYQSITDYHVGILRYANNTNSSVEVRRKSVTNVALDCVSNCSSSSCKANLNSTGFNPGSTQWQTVTANSYLDYSVGTTVRVDAGCTGVFEGVIPVTVGVKNTAPNQTYNLGAKVIVGNIPTITVTPQDDLDFGDILSTTASTVTVGTNGVRTCSPASVCVANQSSNGTFRVENSSATAQTFTVDCPSGAVQMGNGSNFYIDSFICSTSSNSVSSSAPATVNVGATLHVPQGQASGEYNTTYTITVNN